MPLKANSLYLSRKLTPRCEDSRGRGHKEGLAPVSKSDHSGKVCSTCGETKSRGEFHRDRHAPDGLSYVCKPCAREKARRWSAENRDRIRPRVRAYGKTKRGREAKKRAQRRYTRSEKGRETIRRSVKRWKLANPEKVRLIERRTRIKTSYGLTVEEYDAIIARGCAICGTKDGRIYLDHNHSTGKVRDALCANCNHGLGHFRDQPELLEVAARYLREHSAAED